MTSESAPVLFLTGILAAALAALGPPVSANAQQAPKSEKSARTDRYGDPLPKGAIGRIGTIRFLYGGDDKVAFSPDGKVLVGVGPGVVSLWDAATGKELRRSELPSALHNTQSFYDNGALSADGRRLWLRTRRGAAFVWDLHAQPDRGPRPAPFKGPHTHFLVPSPDGKIVAAGDKTSIRLWDADTGEEIRCLKGRTREVTRAAFSADGKIATANNNKTIRIWAIESGQTLRAISVPESVTELAFSSDGRLLAAISGPERPLRLWEIASGKEIQTLHNAQGAQKDPAWVNHFVLSPDNRRMIGSDGSGNLFCWDIRSGTLLGRWKAHATGFAFLRISADNQTVVTSDQTTTLVWSLAEFLPKEKEERADLLPAALSACWADLKDEDATRAYRAIWRLSASPPHAVAFLRERLRPAREPDKTNTARIAKLVGDLDSDAFSARENASRELATFGREAEPALRKALASSPSAECKRRIEELVRKIPESLPSPPPEQLRQLRALAVLEYTATSEAKKCLQTLAGGTAEARLTRESKAALDRLVRKSNTAP